MLAKSSVLHCHFDFDHVEVSMLYLFLVLQNAWQNFVRVTHLEVLDNLKANAIVNNRNNPKGLVCNYSELSLRKEY